MTIYLIRLLNMKLSNTHIQTMEPSRYDDKDPELDLGQDKFDSYIKAQQDCNNMLYKIVNQTIQAVSSAPTNITTSTDIQLGYQFAMVRTDATHLDRLYEFESDLYEIMKHAIKPNDPYWENNNKQNMKASIFYPFTDERIYVERNGKQCKYLYFYIDKDSKNNTFLKMNLYIEVNEHYMLSHSDLSNPIIYTRKDDRFYKLILDSDDEMFNFRAHYFCLNPLLKNRDQNEFFIESENYVIEVTYDNKKIIETTLWDNKPRNDVFEIVEKYINERYASFNVQLGKGYTLAKINNNYILLPGYNPVQLSFHKDGYKLLIQDDVYRLVVDDGENNCDYTALKQNGEKLIKVITTDEIESHHELNEEYNILNHMHKIYVRLYASLDEITKKIDDFCHCQIALKLNIKTSGILTVEDRFSQLPSDWVLKKQDSWYCKLPLINKKAIDPTEINDTINLNKRLFYKMSEIHYTDEKDITKIRQMTNLIQYVFGNLGLMHYTDLNRIINCIRDLFNNMTIVRYCNRKDIKKINEIVNLRECLFNELTRICYHVREDIDYTKINEFFNFHEHLFNNLAIKELNSILKICDNNFYKFVTANYNTDLECIDQVNQLDKILLQLASKIDCPISEAHYYNNIARFKKSVLEMKNQIENLGHYRRLLLDFESHMKQIICGLLSLYVRVKNTLKNNIHSELINKYFEYTLYKRSEQYEYIINITVMLQDLYNDLKNTGTYIKSAADVFKQCNYDSFIKCLQSIDDKDNKYYYVQYINLESYYDKEIKNSIDINDKILLSQKHVNKLYKHIFKDLYKYIRDKRELFAKNFFETTKIMQ